MANNIEEIIKKKLMKAIAGLPVVLGNEAVNYSLDAFKNQAWDGAQWKKRKSKRGQNGTILVKTGRGRRSIRILEVGENRVVYGTDVSYMRAHNEGFTGPVSVKSYTRKKFGSSKVYSLSQKTRAGNRKTKTVSFVTGEIKVRAHTRNMNLPRRQFADSGTAHSQALIKRLTSAGKAHIFKQLK